VRVGTLSMMQGMSAVSQDLPPFTVGCEINTLIGLNTVGLRRAGLTSPQRVEIRRLYHLLFRSGKRMSVAIEEARPQFTSDVAKLLLDFAATTKRGLCMPAVTKRDSTATGDEEEGE